MSHFKMKTLLTTSYISHYLGILTFLTFVGCSTEIDKEVNIETNQTKKLITQKNIGDFYLESDPKNIKLEGFESVEDTWFQEDEGEKSDLKICRYKNGEFVEFYSSENYIYDIRTNSKMFVTKENYSVGDSFNKVIKALKTDFESIGEDGSQIILLDTRNHLRLRFSNSKYEDFESNMINDLFYKKNSIDKERGEKMILEQIDLFLIKI